jgi:hypothetical protein
VHNETSHNTLWFVFVARRRNWGGKNTRRDPGSGRSRWYVTKTNNDFGRGSFSSFFFLVPGYAYFMPNASVANNDEMGQSPPWPHQRRQHEGNERNNAGSPTPATALTKTRRTNPHPHPANDPTAEQSTNDVHNTHTNHSDGDDG